MRSRLAQMERYAMAASLLLAGIVLVVSASRGTGALSHSLMWQLGGVLLTAGTVAVVVRFFVVDRTFQAHAGASEQWHRIGLVSAWPAGAIPEYREAIAEARQLTVVLNDGNKWVLAFAHELERRFADPNKETAIFLIHPDSPTVAVLAQKTGLEEASVRANVLESVRLLNELRGSATSLEILGHSFYNPLHVTLADDSAYVSPYFASRGRREAPVFRFVDAGENSYFRSLADDLEALRMDSQDISRPRSTSTPRRLQNVAW